MIGIRDLARELGMTYQPILNKVLRWNINVLPGGPRNGLTQCISNEDADAIRQFYAIKKARKKLASGEINLMDTKQSPGLSFLTSVVPYRDDMSSPTKVTMICGDKDNNTYFLDISFEMARKLAELLAHPEQLPWLNPDNAYVSEGGTLPDPEKSD